MPDQCPKCASAIVNRCPGHRDEDRSWVGGYVRYACGVEYWNECKQPFYTKQTADCLVGELRHQLAAKSAECERLREAFAASHDWLHIAWNPDGFWAYRRGSGEKLSGPCDSALDAALAALAPTENEDERK